MQQLRLFFALALLVKPLRRINAIVASCWNYFTIKHDARNHNINPYPTAFPYGNGTVLHFYQQQESSTTKTVHKVINKKLKAYV